MKGAASDGEEEGRLRCCSGGRLCRGGLARAVGSGTPRLGAAAAGSYCVIGAGEGPGPWGPGAAGKRTCKFL